MTIGIRRSRPRRWTRLMENGPAKPLTSAPPRPSNLGWRDAVPWARLVIVGDDGDRIELALVSPVEPDLGTIENLARLQLQARRAGTTLALRYGTRPRRGFWT